MEKQKKKKTPNKNEMMEEKGRMKEKWGCKENSVSGGLLKSHSSVVFARLIAYFR